jgi:putative ABC transport system substrate-binding protein
VKPRPVLILGLALGLLTAPLGAQAHQSPKAYRIGFLGTAAPTSDASPITMLRQALRDLGYAEGRNLIIEYRSAGDNYDRLPGLAAELVGLKVDVIVTYGTPGCRAAKQATTTIPIVMAAVGDPVRSGLVASLAKPGGNMTGLSIQDFELIIKRLALLKEVAPTVSRVAYLEVPGTQPTDITESLRKEQETAAKSIGIQLQQFAVRGIDDYPSAFSAMAKNGAQALSVASVAPLGAHAAEIAARAAQHRLPTVGGPKGFAEAGGLLAYGPSLPDLYRRAATYVDKILKGAKPSDLPVEQPTKFELVINMKTAKALGLTIPPSLLLRADEVIQ